MDNLLLCCDLDRTVIPNGEQTESVSARALFHKLTAQDQVTLAYVSGRDKSLLRSAIERYQLPIPNFAIGDVGTTIYSQCLINTRK